MWCNEVEKNILSLPFNIGKCVDGNAICLCYIDTLPIKCEKPFNTVLLLFQELFSIVLIYHHHFFFLRWTWWQYLVWYFPFSSFSTSSYLKLLRRLLGTSIAPGSSNGFSASTGRIGTDWQIPNRPCVMSMEHLYLKMESCMHYQPLHLSVIWPTIYPVPGINNRKKPHLSALSFCPRICIV